MRHIWSGRRLGTVPVILGGNPADPAALVRGLIDVICGLFDRYGNGLRNALLPAVFEEYSDVFTVGNIASFQ